MKEEERNETRKGKEKREKIREEKENEGRGSMAKIEGRLRREREDNVG